MQRILIVGSGGAGKSTAAREVGARLGLPVLHLDRHFHRPDWVETPHAEWADMVGDLVAADRWVMDGNYSGTIDVRLARADAVVLLDLPRSLCVVRVLRRWWRYRGTTRPDVAAGCPEAVSVEFLRWIWTYPARSRPKVLAAVERAGMSDRLVRLRSPRAVRRWLAAIAPGSGADPG